MKRKIITTADGSKTIKIEEWNEQYHSIHGAIAEAEHVFIKSALLYYIEKFPLNSSISVLEMGFGTGLNALLTKLKAKDLTLDISYTGLEAYPIAKQEMEQLNYSEFLEASQQDFVELHNSKWEDFYTMSPNFKLKKHKLRFEEFEEIDTYELIFFDAFGPRVQPELWTEDIFAIMHKALKPRGILTTYCCQGNARRAMLAAGFKVEKIPGPPGKREMLRATKD